MEFTEDKLTDDLERRLIQHELDCGAGTGPSRASVLLLQAVVGLLLVFGVALLAVRFN